ncbi:N-methyl-L-tryptophan oxidase [Aeribacillus composti]|uniref:N-methyl-L-tryptophan oxidase n=1 Tax=Aeribacillus composti TaxID=1868734 RepID=UPI002E23A654|nr:N-methyl-L-tryptophan oxidase [Aeribacillus composti]
MNYDGMYDVIVIGAGSAGSAAAYYLAQNGQSVLMIDQFSVPNSFASHAGETRMLRFGYGQGEKYVDLVKEAYRLWMELQEQTGKTLFYQTGTLVVGERDSSFVNETIQSSIHHNLPIEMFTASMVMNKWQGIQIPEDFTACFDPQAGFLLCEVCIQTYKEEALKLGAKLLENNPVLKLSIQSDMSEVITEKGRFQAANLVITAGAWIPKLLPELDFPIQVIRKPVAWFAPLEDGLYDFGQFPAFVFDTKEGHYYGFPNFRKTGVKIGRHDMGIESDPDSVNRLFGSYCEDERDVRSFLEKYMPQAAGELTDGKICLYSLTPDSDFIIDFHPNFSNVLLAGGFSGHGFKFASIVGSILADLVTRGKTKHDISFFRLNRFEQIATES